MVNDGLSIDEVEFMKMKPKQQMGVLYRNTRMTIDIVKRYKFHQKAQYILIGVLTSGMMILFQLYIK